MYHGVCIRLDLVGTYRRKETSIETLLGACLLCCAVAAAPIHILRATVIMIILSQNSHIGELVSRTRTIDADLDKADVVVVKQIGLQRNWQ